MAHAYRADYRQNAIPESASPGNDSPVDFLGAAPSGSACGRAVVVVHLGQDPCHRAGVQWRTESLIEWRFSLAIAIGKDS
jgi:hypothetical protein